MAPEREPIEALRWLLEPPGPRDIHLHVNLGQETELTPAVRQALDELLRTLEGADVGGFRLRDSCTGYYSGPCFTLSVCPDYTNDPCAAYYCHPVSCRICTGLTGIIRR
jgi:hypothetical protein